MRVSHVRPKTHIVTTIPPALIEDDETQSAICRPVISLHSAAAAATLHLAPVSPHTPTPLPLPDEVVDCPLFASVPFAPLAIPPYTHTSVRTYVRTPPLPPSNYPSHPPPPPPLPSSSTQRYHLYPVLSCHCLNHSSPTNLIPNLVVSLWTSSSPSSSYSSSSSTWLADPTTTTTRCSSQSSA
ncbi:uncharacterized protein LOC135198278 [Macrobrachium nipponense]|uniref:uncharacterized protein LOC135198278 n=1 Tax=Macrobrachium nipponense TaxID=159736 RepID=UPI0030C8CE4B